MKKIKSKEENISLVIKTIMKKGPISKRDISSITGLSPASLTIICKTLLKEKIIIENGEVVENKAGRRRQLVEINPTYKFTIGVNISLKSVTYTIIDLKGTTISKECILINIDNPAKLLQAISSKLQEIILKLKAEEKELLGVGISIIGRVDNSLGKTLVPIGAWDKEVDIVKILQKDIGLPIKIYNNVQAMAVYESFLDDKMKDFFFVKYDRGIGGAAIINGIFSQNNSLEFGHSILDMESEDYCPMCKRKGCLENSISTVNILETIRRDFSKDSYPNLYKITLGNPDLLTFDNVIQSAEEGGIKECLILKKSAKLMSIALLNVYSIIPVKQIVLNGQFFKSKLYLEYLSAYLREYQLTDFSSRLSPSKIKSDSLDVAAGISFIKEYFYYSI